MALLKGPKQSLTDVTRSTNVHDVGDRFWGMSPNDRPVLYEYRRNTSGSTLAAGYVCKPKGEGEVTKPTTALLAFRNYVAMAALPNNYYGWFAIEGDVEADVNANASGLAISADSNLIAVNAQWYFQVETNSTHGHAKAVDAATAAGEITVELYA